MPDPTSGQIAINIKMGGMKRIYKFLALLSAHSIDLQPAMDDAADIMHGQIMDNFDRKVSSGGGKWKPVREWYALRKAEDGREPSNILVYNGELRQSFANGMVTTQNTAAVGTNVKYARIHNFGGTVGGSSHFAGATMPKREFLYLTQDAKRQIRIALLRFISEHIIIGGG